MTEMDVWSMWLQGGQMTGIAFASVAFLIWVGFRISNNVSNSESPNIIDQIAATVFVLMVALNGLFISSLVDWINNGIAGILQAMADAGSEISGGAAQFISMNNPGADWTLVPNIFAALFWLSILVMQLSGIWGRKGS